MVVNYYLLSWVWDATVEKDEQGQLQAVEAGGRSSTFSRPCCLPRASAALSSFAMRAATCGGEHASCSAYFRRCLGSISWRSSLGCLVDQLNWSLMTNCLMKPPIILNESQSMAVPGDVMLFTSFESAVSYLEPIDVENEEYFAFDSEGRLLALSINDSTGRIEVASRESKPGHVLELRAVLCGLLSIYGGERLDWCEGASLPDLVAAAADRFGYPRHR